MAEINGVFFSFEFVILLIAVLARYFMMKPDDQLSHKDIVALYVFGFLLFGFGFISVIFTLVAILVKTN